jgi:cell division septum initiation protein DivIVA
MSTYETGAQGAMNDPVLQSDSRAGAQEAVRPDPGSPEEIRREIERTRAGLSRDVNALGDAVTPGHLARRGADRAKQRAISLRERVMGSASNAAGSTHSAVSNAGDTVSDTVSSAGEHAGDAVRAVKQQATGSPLTAGLVALGVGWLVGSLLPASQKEQEMAQAVQEKAEPVVEQAKSTATDVARESADHLKEPARDAAQSVRDQAQSAVENVKEEGKDAAGSVQDTARSGSSSGASDTPASGRG